MRSTRKRAALSSRRRRARAASTARYRSPVRGRCRAAARSSTPTRARAQGYFDLDSDSGVALDGTRAQRGATPLEFEPAATSVTWRLLVKHAHSGDNPESQWGRHVLQAARFGLAMLDRAFPQAAPFTVENTHHLPQGISNGGGAVCGQRGSTTRTCSRASSALEPNVHVEGYGRALYDYVTEAALLMPCALADARFISIRRSRARKAPSRPRGLARCAHLREVGLVEGADVAAQSRSALDRLHGRLARRNDRDAASSTAFDLWRAVGATYASAYLRAAPGATPCVFRSMPCPGERRARSRPMRQRVRRGGRTRAAFRGTGVMLLGGVKASADPTAPGVRAQRYGTATAKARAHYADNRRDRREKCRARICRSSSRKASRTDCCRSVSQGAPTSAFLRVAAGGSMAHCRSTSTRYNRTRLRRAPRAAHAIRLRRTRCAVGLSRPRRAVNPRRGLSRQIARLYSIAACSVSDATQARGLSSLSRQGYWRDAQGAEECTSGEGMAGVLVFLAATLAGNVTSLLNRGRRVPDADVFVVDDESNDGLVDAIRSLEPAA